MVIVGPAVVAGAGETTIAAAIKAARESGSFTAASQGDPLQLRQQAVSSLLDRIFTPP